MDLDKLKNEFDKARSNLGKMAGSGPLNTRRGAEKNYAVAYDRLAKELVKVEPGMMISKRKYRNV